MVPYAHTVVVWVVKRGRGTPDKHGAYKAVFKYLLFSDELTHTVVPCSFDRRNDPNSGSICPHSGCLCCERGGGTLFITMGP